MCLVAQACDYISLPSESDEYHHTHVIMKAALLSIILLIAIFQASTSNSGRFRVSWMENQM